MNNKPYLVALNHLTSANSRLMNKLLSHWPDLRELFALPESALTAMGLAQPLARAIAHYVHDDLEADWRWQEQQHQYILTSEDAAYPALLKEIADPPPVLYAKGDLSAMDAVTVAMVGTRKPSVTGSETARYFARQLSARGVVVVSGLALGIDAEAHQGCLEAGGKTIAVMGTGMAHIYPHRHQSLAENICRQGLLLSEFPLKAAPIAGHFPRRNRIISGLSLITLVVEAALKSGSLITARLALEQNRDVLAIPGSIYNAQSAGCHHLLQQGAKLVTSVDDVLEELNIDACSVTTKTIPVPSMQVRLACGNKNLVQFIGFELTTVDHIVQRSGLDVTSVACRLAELEVLGEVKAVRGGYVRCVNERDTI